MSWRHWICDARTGQVVCPVDIPNFQWESTGRQQSFSTASREMGDRSASNLTVPWGAVPATGPVQRNRLLDPTRRALCMCWKDDDTSDQIGDPILWGVIGQRQDRQADTSFPLESPMDLLSQRVAVREGTFHDGYSPDTVSYSGLSYRAIMSDIGQMSTDRKQGGTLPIDWPYTQERGTRRKNSLHAWNVQNNKADKLLTDIANLINGPDFAFEPYLADGQHIRVRFIAGSDADLSLYAGTTPVELSYYPGAGQLDELQISHAAPIQRWYASGAGTDEATITAYAEDMTEVTSRMDAQILRESTYSDTDTENVDVLKKHVLSRLEANKRKLIQITATVDFSDTAAGGIRCTPSTLRPGMPATLHINGFPSLPDADYPATIMKISGNQTSKAQITFDVMDNPIQ